MNRATISPKDELPMRKVEICHWPRSLPPSDSGTRCAEQEGGLGNLPINW